MAIDLMLPYKSVRCLNFIGVNIWLWRSFHLGDNAAVWPVNCSYENPHNSPLASWHMTSQNLGGTWLYQFDYQSMSYMQCTFKQSQLVEGVLDNAKCSTTASKRLCLFNRLYQDYANEVLILVIIASINQCWWKLLANETGWKHLENIFGG